MNERLVISKPTSRSKIETVAAIIALAAHRRKLTRWVVTKQDVFDLLSKHSQLQNRVRTASFHNNLLAAMNEYDIAMFEINPNTWGFIRHDTTRNWHRVTWNLLTEGELTNPNVFEIEAAFGYLDAALGTDEGNIGERYAPEPPDKKVKARLKERFKVLKKRFASLRDGYPIVQAYADSFGPQQALRTENIEALETVIKSMESMILAPAEHADEKSHQLYMVEIALLEHNFDTRDLIRDPEGNRCEVTERHIANRAWNQFLRYELGQIIDGLKLRLRERYGV